MHRLNEDEHDTLLLSSTLAFLEIKVRLLCWEYSIKANGQRNNVSTEIVSEPDILSTF
jgi:hypothetical protein